MDPALSELLEGEPSEEIEALVKLRDPRAVPARVRPISAFGPILTCRVERRHVRDVWGHPDVLSIKAPRLLSTEPQAGDAESAGDVAPRATDVRRPAGVGQTGRGVVVALADVGLDFAHPHFRRPDGSTRLLALWDQAGRSPSSTEVNPYGYGVVHARADIDRALREADPYAALGYHPASADPTGLGAHGTLVMDVAAGNGAIAGSPCGLAPEADLLFVHVDAGVGGSRAGLGDSVRVAEAIDFVRRTAGGAPWVANISLGRRAGAHDGLSLVEQALDAALLDAPGRAIVLSTGNYYAAEAHASGFLAPGERRALEWRVDPADVTPNELEIWYSGRDVLGVEVASPDGRHVFRAALGESRPILVDGRRVGHLYHRLSDPTNGDHHVDVFLQPSAPPGAWRVVLAGEDVVVGRFDAWVERDVPAPHCDSRFRPEDVDPASTTGTICNGLRTIAVGAYDGHAAAHPLAPFSSGGPTRDGRQKPDLVAPGARVLGARSAPAVPDARSQALTRMSGTSFAAPHVTGTIALMFEAAAAPLPIQETRRLLLGSARSRTADRARVGSGELDTEAAVRAAAARASPAVGGPGARATAVPAMEGPMEHDQLTLPADAVDTSEAATPKKLFVLVSGGPGPFDRADRQHDQGWHNYVTPPLLLTDSPEKLRAFVRDDERVLWVVYRPAYEDRWAGDVCDPARRKAVEEVRAKGSRSYAHHVERRAASRGWTLRWIEDADGFWRTIADAGHRSISRLWYWGHAAGDLLLRYPALAGEIVDEGRIDAALAPRFARGGADRIHRFVGCNTASFAKRWAKAFAVHAEGVEGPIHFKSIHATGGWPCLLPRSHARRYGTDGAELAGAPGTPYAACAEGHDEAAEVPPQAAAVTQPRAPWLAAALAPPTEESDQADVALASPWPTPADPGFARDDELQRALDALGATRAMKHLRFAVADLGGDAAHPRYAGYRDTAQSFAASLPKIGVMMAAFQLREAVRQAAGGVAAATGAELLAKIAAAWKPLIRARFPRRGADGPQLARILRVIPGRRAGSWSIDFTSDGLAPDELARIHSRGGSRAGIGYLDRLRLMIWHSDNAAAAACIRDLGFQLLNGVLEDAGLYGASGGLWIGADYGGRRWGADPVGKTHQGATAAAVARFLSLLAQERLVSAAASREMRDLMGGAGSWFRDALLAQGRTLDLHAAKVGVAAGLYCDCIWVERTDARGSPLRYAAVGLNARNAAELGRLAVELDDVMSAVAAARRVRQGGETSTSTRQAPLGPSFAEDSPPASMPHESVPSHTVLDPDARIRSAPPQLRSTGRRIPRFARVRVLETSGKHARVQGEDGTEYGWTALANLGTYFKDDALLLATPLAPATPIAVPAGATAVRRALAGTYARLGGLMTALSSRLGVPLAGVLSVWKVESGGRGHTPGRAVIRFENHLLYRAWGDAHPDDYDLHFQHGGRAGIPGRPWTNHRFRAEPAGPFRPFHGDQAAEYEVLARATQLAGEDTALRCISIGGPQILVSNHRMIGYASPREMYDAFQGDERAHVLGFFDFCQYREGHGSRRGELIRYLAAERWEDFARAYNGAGQVAHYAGAIRDAFDDATAMLAAASNPVDAVAELGDLADSEIVGSWEADAADEPLVALPA